jgi:hypothetical protein
MVKVGFALLEDVGSVGSKRKENKRGLMFAFYLKKDECRS